MLKSDVEKDIEEGGPGSGPREGDKRGHIIQVTKKTLALVQKCKRWWSN